MILQELCKCFIMFHHLQISDINSTKYFGMSLCTLELSVIFLAIWQAFFALWGLYYPYQMVHTLLPGEFGTPLFTFELLFWSLLFFFIEFGSFFWCLCVWEFCFLYSSSVSSAQWCLMLSYFCVLLKDIFKVLLWWVDPTLLLSTSFYCHSPVSSYYFIWAETFFISSSCVWLLCMFFCWQSLYFVISRLHLSPVCSRAQWAALTIIMFFIQQAIVATLSADFGDGGWQEAPLESGSGGLASCALKINCHSFTKLISVHYAEFPADFSLTESWHCIGYQFEDD